MTDSLRIVSVQIGACQSYFKNGDPNRPWVSAIEKSVVFGPVPTSELGLDGDEQADKVHHGGVDKAVLGYCESHYSFWKTEFPEINWGSGAFGENLTLSGMLESEVCVGDIFECQSATAGGLCLQVSQPREPCWKLSQRWGLPKLAVRVQATRRTGWYMRVLHRGDLQAGQTLSLVERPHPEFTIDVANDILFAKPRDAAADLRLAGCQHLSEAWKENLIRRSAKHVS
ncbi:MOSC domain-containing protein [Rhodopirellula bahusiensis]|uniref:MOSC domain-containing protein n=1 Tax=Rhodopirellula bahusiensis TaxID=2014065 RepID=A0A2G1WBP0_9BACT|nr:MOSC domain-containing protein [Rhodopirellula bahusiensis]PHQ36426.1 MOSC domain-containing protein [Rhodopirellula bahusiensis]